MEEQVELMTLDNIYNRVYIIRGEPVMLDTDLALIYGYEVKRLNQQVKRNINRFPTDFMFQLSEKELEELRLQNVTANINSMSRTLPYAFTKQGIYMLATVLRGELAEQQSIFIMRAFFITEKSRRGSYFIYREWAWEKWIFDTGSGKRFYGPISTASY